MTSAIERLRAELLRTGTDEERAILGETSSESDQNDIDIDGQSSVAEDESSSGSDTEREEMSKEEITFTGKANELDQLKLLCQLEFATNTKLDGKAKQAAFFAKRFRGKALTWLVRKQKENSELLSSYADLLEATETAFGLSSETRKATAAKQLPNLKQTTSVQAYIQTFDACVDQLTIDESLKKTFFVKGLKLHVREALVASGSYTDYGETREEAQRIDEELFNAKRFSRRSGNRGGQGGASTAREGTGKFRGKCHGCGQFGHRKAECPAQQQY